jgi:seryl-tRNA synthetase
VIDIKALREDPEAVRASQRARGEDEHLVDAVLRADERRRGSLAEYERLRAAAKAVSRDVGVVMAALGAARKAGHGVLPAQTEADQARARAAELSDRVKAAETAAGEADREYVALLRRLPNVVVPGVPTGGPDDFVVLETVGQPRDFDAEGFPPQDHLAVAERLGAIDMARGVKVAQARFYYLVGQGARLESGLTNLALRHAHQAGFIQLSVPTLVNPTVMEGAGFLDAHADEVYHLGVDDLYLTGTSEVALAGFHAQEILDLSAGPRRYVAASTCYRREAGSYGKDTRGIIRVHQFQKVEMFVYCRPEDAPAEHEAILGHQRQMLDAVEVPYRVIDVAAGDLGGPAARKYDCEGWMPSQGVYRELTSASNCTTYQARRLGVRERRVPEDGAGTRTVATLNGTLATTRWLAAMLENHQQADGAVLAPKALRELLGADRLTPGAS